MTLIAQPTGRSLRDGVFAGVKRTISYTAKNSAGTVVDLTGASIAWKIARRFGEGDILSKSVGSGIAVDNAASGTFTVTLTADDTNELWGNYVFECIVTDSGGSQHMVARGDIEVKADIK
jgi:hypothetical protein